MLSNICGLFSIRSKKRAKPEDGVEKLDPEGSELLDKIIKFLEAELDTSATYFELDDYKLGDTLKIEKWDPSGDIKTTLILILIASEDDLNDGLRAKLAMVFK